MAELDVRLEHRKSQVIDVIRLDVRTRLDHKNDQRTKRLKNKIKV